MLRHAVIRCAWDAEAEVWYVQDTDIPGLLTEAPTLDALRAKLPGMVQDLLDDAGDIEIDLIAYAHDRVRVEAA